MLFTSHLFIFLFLPAVVLACWQAQKNLGRWAAVAAISLASLVFYYANSQSQISVLLASVAFNFTLNWLAFKSHDGRQQWWLCAILIAGNLACLAYYKYAAFILGQFGRVDTGTFAAIVLPLGLSFFTFQQIAYACDVKAGRVREHRFLDYVFCVLFFPHLIAGPIVNYRELIPQLKLRRLFSFGRIDLAVGISVFIVGLLKKTLLADTFAGFVSPAFNAAEAGKGLSAWMAWTGVLAYTFQIYFDFSGYSDMAIGLARIFGVQLPANFASPYKAASIIEFWRRWHMTLSRFLRQYLYIPLGGNRGGQLRRYRNLMITMLLGGLWHGAGWNFVLWGGMHGGMLAVNHLCRESGATQRMAGWVPRLWAPLCGAITFLGVMMAWVLFRAETLRGASRMYSATIGLRNSAGESAANLAASDLKFLALAVAASAIVFCLPNTQELFARYRVSERPEGAPLLVRSFVAWRPTYAWLMVFAVLAGVACFYQPEFPEFLYWRF